MHDRWLQPQASSVHVAFGIMRQSPAAPRLDQTMGADDNREAALNKLLTEMFDGDPGGLLQRR